MKSIPSITLLLFLCTLNFGCDRTAAVQEAKEDNSELAPVTTTTTARDQSQTDVEQRLELKKVQVAASPLKDLSKEERNTKLIEATDDEVATQAITFMESRIKLTDEQKSEIIAYSQQLNLSDKSATDRRTALKTMRKKIKQDILTDDQLRQFKKNK